MTANKTQPQTKWAHCLSMVLLLLLWDFFTLLNQQRKAHLFHFVKTLHFSPRLSISRCVNFIKISFSEVKCWLYGALSVGSHSHGNVWSLLRHFCSTENSLENRGEEPETCLVLEDSLASWIFYANRFVVEPKNQQHSNPVYIQYLSLTTYWEWGKSS